ncbi:hypothetical protein [Catenulispora subtropica]|uniref:hypothetical protein n=1 Tax=Catenulispora subtropica TaxID=450798 RepID=UPI0031D55D1E
MDIARSAGPTGPGEHSEHSEHSEQAGSGAAEPEPAPSAATVAGLTATVRRQRLLLWVTVVATVASGGGLAASTLIRSPAEQAARSGAPAPNVLTAPVVRRVLSNAVILRGTVGPRSSIPVTPVKAAAAGDGAQLLVTALRKKPGDAVGPGDVIIEVSGRPVIALPGSVPAYRDLRPGADGADVAELQDALKALGHPCAPDAHGHFGAGTKAALTALYAHLGYDVPTTGGPGDREDKAALQAAANAVVTAQRTVATDQTAVDRAKAALDAAKKAAASPSSGTPSSGEPSAGAPPGGGSGESPVRAAQDTLDTARTTLSYARADLTQAEQNHADLVAATGPMLPVSEAVFVPTLPVHVEKVNGQPGSVVAAPLVTLAGGDLAVTAMLSSAQQEQVKPGMRAELLAEAQGGAPVGGTVGTVGPYTAGASGDGQSGPSGQSEQSGQSGQSGGSSGGNGSNQPGQTVAGFPVTIVPDAPLPAGWNGSNIRVTVTSAATPKPVLVVPLSAVTAQADGKTVVTVATDGDGGRRRVPVSPGVSGDGFVEVTPDDPTALTEGTPVIVGTAGGS